MTVVNSSYIRHNNYVINEISIRNDELVVNVTTAIEGVLIFESLDSLVHGKLLLHDHSGLVDRLKMSGNEMIDISFQSYSGSIPDEKYEKTFRIVSYVRGTDEMGINEIIEMHFENQAIIENNLVKKSRPYVNMAVSDIIKNLLSGFNSLSNYKIDIEPTLYTRVYYATMLRPFTIIQDLLKNCASKINRSCKFFFYEDREGIKVKSLGSLKSAEPVYTIKKEGQSVTQLTSPSNNIIFSNKLYTKAGTNLVDTIRNGIYGNRTVTHSLINKKLTYHNIDRESFIASNPLMNAKPQRQDDSIRKSDMPFTTTVLMPADGFYKDSGSLPQGHLSGVQVVETAHIITKGVLCMIPGNTNLKVGDTVYLDHVTLSDEVNSKVLSGKWIISALKHDLSTKTFYTHLELMTDSDVRDI